VPAAQGAHTVLPAASAKRPFVHAWQCVGVVRSELAPNLPAAHLVHADAVPSSCANWPIGHSWQCSAAEACGPLPNVPAMQASHAVPPAALCRPMGHSAQCALPAAGSPRPKRPAVHGVQPPWSACRKCPAAQTSHLKTFAKRPGVHLAHAVAAPTEVEPAAHFVHAMAPAVPAKVEAMHGAHDFEAASGAKEPAAHGTQTALPGGLVVPAAQGRQAPLFPNRPTAQGTQSSARAWDV